MIAHLLRRWADRLDPPRDYTMAQAQAFGLLFSETQEVPRKIASHKSRAMVVAQLDREMVPELHGGNQKELYRAFRIAWSVLEAYAPGLPEADAISVGLRLWAGAISGAKLVAYQTRSGVNDRRYRERTSFFLARRCREDQVFAAGVGCAPELKKMRGQRVNLDGVHQAVRQLMGV